MCRDWTKSDISYYRWECEPWSGRRAMPVGWLAATHFTMVIRGNYQDGRLTITCKTFLYPLQTSRPNWIWWLDLCSEDWRRVRGKYGQIQEEPEEQDVAAQGGEDGELPQGEEQWEDPGTLNRRRCQVSQWSDCCYIAHNSVGPGGVITFPLHLFVEPNFLPTGCL